MPPRPRNFPEAQRSESLRIELVRRLAAGERQANGRPISMDYVRRGRATSRGISVDQARGIAQRKGERGLQPSRAQREALASLPKMTKYRRLPDGAVAAPLGSAQVQRWEGKDWDGLAYWFNMFDIMGEEYSDAR